MALGIKRGVFRRDDAAAASADAAFDAVRPHVLEAARYRCQFCTYESSPVLAKKRGSALQVHHRDDNHHNNSPDNLVAACALCHAYHHIGCNAASPGCPTGWASMLRLAFLPELSAADCNALQRAVGAALSDEAEAGIAREVVNLLGTLALPVRDAWGSNKARDFAACLDSMTAAEYAGAKKALSDLRLLFHPESILKPVGQQMLEDAPLLPVRSWAELFDGADDTTSVQGA